MKSVTRKARLVALAAAFVVLVVGAAQAGPLTYSRSENRSPPPGAQNRIGVGVVPRTGIGVVPRTGIGADTGIGAISPEMPVPSGVLSPSVAESPATIRAAQEALRGEGLAPDTNGIVGPRTRQAIRTFQENHGLPITGELDNATRQRLGLP